MRKIDRRIVIVASVVFILILAYGIMRFLAAMKPPPPMRQAVEARRFVRIDVVRYSDITAALRNVIQCSNYFVFMCINAKRVFLISVDSRSLQ